MTTSAANERVFSMDGQVVNGREANTKRFSVNDILFKRCSVKAALKFDYVSHFYFTVFLIPSVGFEMNH